MSRIEEARKKSKVRKEKEKQEFLDDINIVHNNIDSVLPMIGIKKELNNCFINYHITKYPMLLVYNITFYKKDYPFNIYYSKKWYKNEIPKKYIKEFEELEKYFNK